MQLLLKKKKAKKKAINDQAGVKKQGCMEGRV
jgi:hypothetical protein